MFFFDAFKGKPRLVNRADTTDLHDGTVMLQLRSYAYGSDYVGGLPSYFFAIREDRAFGARMGLCDLRVGDTPELFYAGQIGYRVHAIYRGQGYARKATRLLLALAHRLDMEEILITCDPDNIASRKTLEGLGGRFAGIVTVPAESVCYASGDREKCQFYFLTKPYAEWLHALHGKS